MRDLARLSAVCLLCVGLFSFFLPKPNVTANGPVSFKDKLTKRIPSFETSGRTMVANIVDLSYQYELPLGLEYVDKDAVSRPIDLHFQNESIENIVVAITQQLPQYRVNFSDGLIDVFVPKERESSANLLNKKITEFNAAGLDTGMANQEVSCSLARAINPSTMCYSSVAIGQLGDNKITLHMRDAKVYELVNAIVAQNGKAMWTITAPAAALNGRKAGDLWHIFPLQEPFRNIVHDRLSRLPQ
jgi:hypothetical protein